MKRLLLILSFLPLFSLSQVVTNFTWSPTPACAGSPVCFTGLYTSPSAVDTWLWDFGDGGSIVMGQNPIHTYLVQGVYMVNLTVWSTVGCIGDTIIMVEVDTCSISCISTEVHNYTTSKKLLKVTDILGRETNQTNQLLFYIYDDGTIERRVVILRY